MRKGERGRCLRYDVVVDGDVDGDVIVVVVDVASFDVGFDVVLVDSFGSVLSFSMQMTRR